VRHPHYAVAVTRFFFPFLSSARLIKFPALFFNLGGNGYRVLQMTNNNSSFDSLFNKKLNETVRKFCKKNLVKPPYIGELFRIIEYHCVVPSPSHRDDAKDLSEIVDALLLSHIFGRHKQEIVITFRYRICGLSSCPLRAVKFTRGKTACYPSRSRISNINDVPLAGHLLFSTTKQFYRKTESKRSGASILRLHARVRRGSMYLNCS